MRQILLVEDSTMFGGVIKKRLETMADVTVVWVKTLQETTTLLEQPDFNFTIALVSLTLSDAPNGEVIDVLTNKGVSVIVLISNLTPEKRELIWAKRSADYIFKDAPNFPDLIEETLQRFFANEHKMVLVVDHNDSLRSSLSELLYIQKYRVLTAKDGAAAINTLERQAEISMVITAFDLPDFDGGLLCQKIREKWSPEELPVLAFFPLREPEVGARLIKSGASEIIASDSFMVEEFYNRLHRLTV